MKKILTINNLNVSFKIQGNELHAVRGIDFYLLEGESLGIIGESGCGKSATAKSILQLLPKQTAKISGEIWYDENNIASFPESKMQEIRGKGIGMIFQEAATSLNPTLKIGPQIIEGYRKHFKKASLIEAEDVACKTLEKLGLHQAKEIMNAYSYALSGGMRQRILIAIALVCQPTILLADEPTTALDITTQAQILQVLKDQKSLTKMSIILNTHDLGLAAKFCDRILVMYAGKIVESATAKELFSNPQHPYTQALLQAIPRFQHGKNQPLKSIEGSPPNLTLPLSYCSFCSRCPTPMNICAKASPPLMQIANTHWSACFKK